MNKIIAGIIFMACAFSLFGWGSAYGENTNYYRGYRHASVEYQKDAENIKRAQGDENGKGNLHSYFVINN